MGQADPDQREAITLYLLTVSSEQHICLVYFVPNLYTGEITTSDKTENMFVHFGMSELHEIKLFRKLRYWSTQIIMKYVQYLCILLREKSHLVGI